MELVGSSHSGDVERDIAVRLLAERAILTRAVCRELAESNGSFADRRPCVALYFLLRWIRETLPESLQIKTASGDLYNREPRPSDGLDRMVVPSGCAALLEELRAGASVGDALSRLLTADNPMEASYDKATIQEGLSSYWARHETSVRAPSPIECWSGHSARGT